MSLPGFESFAPPDGSSDRAPREGRRVPNVVTGFPSVPTGRPTEKLSGTPVPQDDRRCQWRFGKTGTRKFRSSKTLLTPVGRGTSPHTQRRDRLLPSTHPSQSHEASWNWKSGRPDWRVIYLSVPLTPVPPLPLNIPRVRTIQNDVRGEDNTSYHPIKRLFPPLVSVSFHQRAPVTDS